MCGFDRVLGRAQGLDELIHQFEPPAGVLLQAQRSQCDVPDVSRENIRGIGFIDGATVNLKVGQARQALLQSLRDETFVQAFEQALTFVPHLTQLARSPRPMQDHRSLMTLSRADIVTRGAVLLRAPRLRHTVEDMRYTTLGNSGTIVSTQCLGTMTFGAEADEETSGHILDAFAEAGGTFIDTADVYSKGVSEEITGRWLKSHPEDAANMVVATKGRFPMGEGHNDVGLSRRHLRLALDASLTRLGVEHIDLYQMHAWDAVTPLEETLRFLDDAVTAGKIGYYGFSNYLGYQVTKAVHTAREHGWTPPVTLQPQYNLLVRDIEHEVVPACLDGGLGLLPWSPLAGGWLTGKYQRDTTPTGASRLGEDPERGMEAYGPRNSDERTWAVIEAVAEVAKEQGITSAQVALAWVAAQPAVTSVILGARTVEQLTDNLAAADVDLTADQLAHLSEVSAPQMDDYPYGAAGIAQRHRSIS